MTTLEELKPGDHVTLLNPQPYSDVTGVVQLPEPGWAGPWVLGGMSYKVYAFQGWVVCDDLCGDVDPESGRTCVQPKSLTSYWHYDGEQSWKSDDYGKFPAGGLLNPKWTCPRCGAVFERAAADFPVHHHCPNRLVHE